jgi:hypothetical protein
MWFLREKQYNFEIASYHYNNIDNLIFIIHLLAIIINYY